MDIRLVLVGCCALTFACSEGDSRGEQENPSTTSVAPRVVVDAQAVCGSADQPLVEVRVTGADGQTLTVELISGGRPVVASSGVPPQAITLDLGRGDDEWLHSDDFQSGGGSVIVRRQDGGPALAEDQSIAPSTLGCG